MRTARNPAALAAIHFDHMIVKREKLTFWERMYLPSIWGGFKITASHLANTLFRGNNAAKQTAGGYYPEVPWTVEPGYRGAPYLVRDQEGKTKCVSCQLCEFVYPQPGAANDSVFMAASRVPSGPSRPARIGTRCARTVLGTTAPYLAA